MDSKVVADWLLFAFAFEMGLAASGLVASALAAAADVRAGFHPPFVRRERLAVSLAITSLAGPVMLFNDVLSAWRRGAAGPALVAAGLLVSIAWTLALGILVTELAWRAGILIT